MNKKRVFVLSLISLAVIVALVGFVSAVNPIFDPIVDMFDTWAEGETSVGVAKYAFWLLLSLVIFTILDFVPFFEKQGNTIKFIIAFLVAFLSTAYLTPGEVYLVLTSYGALGILLGTAIPFVILLFFSVEMHKEGGSTGRIFARVLWLLFILLMIYKVLQGMIPTLFGLDTQAVIGGVEGLVYLGFVLGAIFWVLKGEEMFFKSVFKEELREAKEGMSESRKEKLVLQIAELQDEADTLRKNKAYAMAKGKEKDIDRIKKILEED